MKMRRGIEYIMLCLGMVLWTWSGFAADIANVTIGFGGNITESRQVRMLIAQQMQTLLESAKATGVTAVNLQSVAYSFKALPAEEDAPSGQATKTLQVRAYQANGNLFIDAEPKEKTADFIALLNKKGYSATINYYRQCVPLSSR